MGKSMGHGGYGGYVGWGGREEPSRNLLGPAWFGAVEHRLGHGEEDGKKEWQAIGIVVCPCELLVGYHIHNFRLIEQRATWTDLARSWT